MKIVVFSDIHGNQYAVRSFLKQIESISYDRLVFCGDIFGYYYGQNEVLDSLSGLQGLLWLKGNHDKYALDIYDGKSDPEYYIKNYGHSYSDLRTKYSADRMGFLAKLPERAEIRAGGKTIGFFHGTPEDALEGRLYPDNEIADSPVYQAYDYVVMGHTHFRMDRRLGGTRVLNPGSLGQQRDGKGCGFLVLDTDEDTVWYQDVSYDKDALYQEIDMYDKELKKLKTVLERRAVE